MRVLLLFIMMTGLTAATPRLTFNANQQEASVYICESKAAYAYHPNRNCSGLNRCAHTISEVSLKAAKQRGYRACQKCY